MLFAARSVFVFAFLPLFTGSTSGQLVAQQPADLPALIRATESAVVSLRVFDAAGRELAEGSGFFISGNRIATNAHVLTGGARVEVLDGKRNLLGSVDHAETLSTTVDLAILPSLSTAPATLPLATSEPAVGERIVAIGSPQGLTNTVSEGIVSAVRERRGGTWLQITSPISPGSSGGPVINHRGEVVGVSVAQLREGQNLNFAVPARDLRALAASPRGRIAFPQQAVGAVTARPQPVVTDTAAVGTSESRFSDLVFGAPVDAVLGSADIPVDGGARMDLYRFDGRAGEVVTLVAMSTDFDTQLLLGYYADGTGEFTEVAEDDDGLGETNALIAHRLPRTGRYVVAVSNYVAGKEGAYRIGLFRGDASDALRRAVENSGRDLRWVPAASTDKFEVHIDRTSIRTIRGQVHEMWIRRSYGSVQRENWGTYDEERILQQVDCGSRRTRTIQISTYLRDQHVDTADWAQRQEWSAWTPESVGEVTGRKACEMAG